MKNVRPIQNGAAVLHPTIQEFTFPIDAVGGGTIGPETSREFSTQKKRKLEEHTHEAMVGDDAVKKYLFLNTGSSTEEFLEEKCGNQ